MTPRAGGRLQQGGALTAHDMRCVSIRACCFLSGSLRTCAGSARASTAVHIARARLTRCHCAEARQAQLHAQLPWALQRHRQASPAVPASCSLLCRGRQDFWICVLLTLLGYLPGALPRSLLPGLTALAGEEQQCVWKLRASYPVPLSCSTYGTDSHDGLPVQVSFSPSTLSCGAHSPS